MIRLFTDKSNGKLLAVYQLTLNVFYRKFQFGKWCNLVSPIYVPLLQKFLSFFFKFTKVIRGYQLNSLRKIPEIILKVRKIKPLCSIESYADR